MGMYINDCKNQGRKLIKSHTLFTSKDWWIFAHLFILHSSKICKKEKCLLSFLISKNFLWSQLHGSTCLFKPLPSTCAEGFLLSIYDDGLKQTQLGYVKRKTDLRKSYDCDTDVTQACEIKIRRTLDLFSTWKLDSNGGCRMINISITLLYIFHQQISKL